MKTIREGGIVAVLIDQNVQEKDGIFVRFFGRPGVDDHRGRRGRAQDGLRDRAGALRAAAERALPA